MAFPPREPRCWVQGRRLPAAWFLWPPATVRLAAARETCCSPTACESLRSAPRQPLRYRIIPYRANRDSRQGRKVSCTGCFVEISCKADVHACTKAAGNIERQPAAQPAHAAQSLVAVGQHIVEREIERHCDDGSGGLTLKKTRVFDLKQQREY